MNRRKFITLLGGSAWPLAARAQQQAMPVVGFLNAASPSQFADRIAAFREGLKKEEFVQDRNVTFEFRWLEGQGYDRAGGRTQKCKIKYKKPTTDIGSGVSTAARRAAARRLLNVCCQFMTTGKFDTALPMRICSPSADDGCRQRLAADVEGDTAAPTSSL